MNETAEETKAARLQDPSADDGYKVRRELVRKALEGAHLHAWTVQGMGMLRLYLGKVARVHIWDSDLRVPGVSMVHNHFWPLKSTVMAGRIRNIRYAVRQCVAAGPERAQAFDQIPTHWSATLQTGEGGGLVGEKSAVVLRKISDETFGPGRSYWQRSEEVHETVYDDGTVTLLERPEGDGAKTATTFWPVHDEWGSAEPRIATRMQVELAVRRALAGWDP